MGMLDDVKSKKKQKAAENWMKMADTAKTIEKQIEYYTKSLDIDPYNAEAWFKKGRCLEKLGRFEEAKKCFDLAIEIDPDYQGLIGKKYEATASPAPSVDEYAVFPPSPHEPVVADESDNEEQWIIETPDPVMAEKSDLSQESEYSFRPPEGDESIFSNVVSEEEDNGSPSIIRNDREDFFGKGYDESPVKSEPEAVSNSNYMDDKEDEAISSFTAPALSEVKVETVEEREDTFSSTPMRVKEESPSSFSSDENIIRSRQPVTSVSERTRSSLADISQAPKHNKQAAEYDAGESIENHVISGYSASSNTIASPKSVVASGVDIMDIRIPLNETIKFWAIGIVAMLIVLLVNSLL
ncbi:tetratricopeptide repeat protein [Methanolobus psychrotolerans]|uniref:tetratricopeptide repeat protein n=1 Tax=Methanolobus psychrotolerans TaxID=1874706 RepID=UPI000B917A33|nr:tetratricopeptide repeat protein [Methanolobus psychrotolerans]